MQRMRLHLLNNLGPPTHSTLMPNLLPLPAAPITLHLDLLEDTRRELMLLNDGAAPLTLLTRIDHAVRGPAALALLADLLFLNGEFVLRASVEIAQRDRHPGLHVRPPPLLLAVAKVPGAPKEAGEEVEGVVPAVLAAALLVLRQPFVPILVVDFARLRLRKRVVGFGNGDEFLRGGFVAPVEGLAVNELLGVRGKCIEGMDRV